MHTTLSTEARQVLELAATGLTVAATAARLGMPIATVRRHLDHAGGLLGASSRLDTIRKAARCGLIELSR